MHLYLSHNSPWNATYTTSEGQVIYKVETPLRLGTRTATIKRVIPSTELLDVGMRDRIAGADHRGEELILEDESAAGLNKRASHDHEFVFESPVGTPSAEGPNFQDRFGLIGQIDFRTIQSSRIHYQGQEVETSAFFRKSGFGWYGRWEGVEVEVRQTSTRGTVPYFILSLGYISFFQLVMNDGAKTPVARFQQQRLGIISKARPASLEIFPAGDHIADVIVVTFVYIEKLRKDRDNAGET
ncbi:hypothetical protein BDQ12DRAFT_727059 [Crucibulum laeve]|uniref:DUF6593 domain-containing protein n=1 Tax=Crucibulum laeve TaxID=68775 RepID=A0A5C3LZU1_9AGAR|nr:hypothetical protein BDQ12DRAFT_727059 [Crucibulum laeve]